MRSRDKFEEVVLNTSSELPLPNRFEIESITETVEISKQGAWLSAILTPKNKISDNVILEKPITVSRKILLEKQSVMRWIVGKMARK